MSSFMKMGLLAGALALSGCASIVSDSQYAVHVTSNPSQAEFTIKNEMGHVIHSGRTPMTVTLKSGDGYFSGANYQIAFSKSGYGNQVVSLNSQLDGWYWGNLLLGGLLGMLVVDPISGAMYKLPEYVDGYMNETSSATEGNKSLQVVSLSDIPVEDRAKLIRVN